MAVSAVFTTAMSSINIIVVMQTTASVIRPVRRELGRGVRRRRWAGSPLRADSAGVGGAYKVSVTSISSNREGERSATRPRQLRDGLFRAHLAARLASGFGGRRRRLRH